MTDPREIIRNGDRDELTESVKEWCNCHVAKIDDTGDIWIAEPQVGHWLDDEQLARFLAWCDEQ